MAYPFTTAGGGISSVAWGDITGTLADQTDLQAALDAKADAEVNLVATDYTSNTYWQQAAYSNEPVSWSGSAWVPGTYSNTDTAYQLRPVGSFTAGMQPPRIDITLNSAGPESGVYTGMNIFIWDEAFNLIGSAPIPFTSWGQTVKVEVETDFVTESPGDIYFLTVTNINTDGVSPTITAIEFMNPA